MESALQTGKIAAVSDNDEDDGDDDDSNTFNLNAFVVVSICNIHTLVLHLFEELNQDQRQRHFVLRDPTLHYKNRFSFPWK